MIAYSANFVVPDLVILPIIFLCLVFWIWTLVDCVKNEKGGQRIGWFLVILLVPLCIGALVYLYSRKQPREKSGNRFG